MKRLFLVVVLLSGCVRGPVTENKTPLSALNGKNYSTTPGGGMVNQLPPIITRRERETALIGKVMVVREKIPEPAANKKLLLTQNGKVLMETKTAADGVFAMAGVFPNGAYLLELELQGKKFAHPIVIRDYELKDISFLVEL
jgi:hypothetical protein